MPKTAKHTPGPWELTHYVSGTWVVAPKADSVEITVCCLPNETVHSTANARLIAAAPDLLEAAKAILQAWQDSPKSHQPHWSKAVNAAAHAIRKAEGE